MGSASKTTTSREDRARTIPARRPDPRPDRGGARPGWPAWHDAVRRARAALLPATASGCIGSLIKIKVGALRRLKLPKLSSDFTVLWSPKMPKHLSENLADLSARAKKAEDSFSAAQKEAHDKLVARREQARAAANTAVEKVVRNSNLRATAPEEIGTL